MYLVGLTGGIASGKSTVAQRLVKHGAELIDADEIAREQLLPGTETFRKVLDHFGESIIDEDGFVDRPKLGRMVFGDVHRRALLNELTHPPVIKEIADRLELLQAFDGVVVLDVPLLVEAGVQRGYDAIVVVAAQPATQRDRLVRHRGMSPEEADERIASQAPLEEKLKIATHVIWNEGNTDELLDEADRLAKELHAAAREKAEREAADIPND